jgi:hypothetical protein
MEERFGQTCPGLPADVINFLHDPLACAIALGWMEGVEMRDLPLKVDIRDGWLYQRVEAGGEVVRVVAQVDGPRFSQFWLKTVTGA